MSEGPEEMLQGGYEGHLGLRDLFHRDVPASLEGDPNHWRIAQEVIDHGCFVLSKANTVREGRGVRDSVTGALLRRALVTAEAVRTLTACGLEEPAAAQFRTLLDVRLNLRLVLSDPSDRMARRLAAYHYLGAKRHLQSQLSDPSRRAHLESVPEHHRWTLDVARKMKGYFDSETFDDVREAVQSSRMWHGFDRVEDAFLAAGMADDYRTLYSTYSPFVHVSNVDFDFVDIDEQGRPVLRALPQRDPARTRSFLLGICLTLIPILKDIVADKGQEDYQEPFRATIEGGDTFDLHPLDVLLHEVLITFDRPGQDPSGSGPPSGQKHSR